MQLLDAAIAEIERETDVNLAELRSRIDRLEVVFAAAAAKAIARGDHVGTGRTPTTYIGRMCGMSRRAAADRLCVGRNLEDLPETANALSKGEIGYQAASAMCHLHEQLGEKWEPTNEGETVDCARTFSVERFYFLCRRARFAADPEGAEKASMEDFERRWLQVEQILDGMYSVNGVLDPVTGAAFRSALYALAEPRGPEDNRSGRQRLADALGEWVNHELDSGSLPRRNGVRPHVALTMSLETLKGELGAAAAELQDGTPIARSTMQRLVCDSSLSRVLIANSVPVDVGRETRSVSPAQWRALKARYNSCAFPDCDRPISWTNPHHIHFWAGGGRSDIDNLIPLCHFHHRLVHEEGWIVMRADGGILFIPPRPIPLPFPRGPGVDLAA